MPTAAADDDFALPLLSVRTSREAAFIALEEFRNSGTWLADVLDRLFRTASLPPRERGLATELACGVVRRMATLDSILKTLVARPLDQVESPLLTVLRLGVYQVALLDGVPQHASVHETVELTKRLGKLRWSGFVNGVLRGATRLVSNEFMTEPSARGVPVTDGRFRQLREAIFADPARDPAHYFADAYSFPLWLGERWLQRIHAPELFRLGAWFNVPGRVVLRVNQLRSTTESLLESFQQMTIPVRRVEEFAAVVLEGASQIERLPGYEQGWFAVQDLSAMQAARRLAPQPGQRVWDVCAAPGGKTCHLAELMNNTGHVLATDVRPERLRLIEENRARLGADIVETRLISEDGNHLPDGPFDAILIDVPCSNTGVLGKRPEARWRITAAGITELNRVQERLLNNALDRLAPNGRVVYSTCSIEPEENHQLIAHVLARRPRIQLVEEELFLPGQPSDGGYQALLRSE
ncbi:MAG: 16S rRNA (cytosine(967)-C(5))-methyltransferase RsmB [Planctomycetes bacterium]|nr:16S rRNA (cytosine(967)-C(5))-methyltransferase RsmB [Planctomycetota bacterium]